MKFKLSKYSIYTIIIFISLEILFIFHRHEYSSNWAHAIFGIAGALCIYVLVDSIKDGVIKLYTNLKQKDVKEALKTLCNFIIFIGIIYWFSNLITFGLNNLIQILQLI